MTRDGEVRSTSYRSVVDQRSTQVQEPTYDDLNLTELVALVQRVEPNAHRGLPREVLLAILEGEDIELPPRTIDKKRLEIMQYVNDHWIAVRAIAAGCPARSRDPHACFGCSDLQVSLCTVENAEQFLDK